MLRKIWNLAGQSNSEHSWYCLNALNHWATGPTAEEQKQVCWSSTAWSPVAWPDCRGVALVHWFCKNVCAKSRRGASLLGIWNSGRVCSHSKLTVLNQECSPSGWLWWYVHRVGQPLHPRLSATAIDHYQAVHGSTVVKQVGHFWRPRQLNFSYLQPHFPIILQSFCHTKAELQKARNELLDFYCGKLPGHIPIHARVWLGLGRLC